MQTRNSLTLKPNDDLAEVGEFAFYLPCLLFVFFLKKNQLILLLFDYYFYIISLFTIPVQFIILRLCLMVALNIRCLRMASEV